MTRFLILLALTAALAGCAAPPPRPVALPLPARPVLQAVDRAAVQCLADDAYNALVGRERAYKDWALELEAIIRTNNGKADAAAH